MALHKLFKGIGIFPLLILTFLLACENPQEKDARKEMQQFETWLDEQSQKTEAWSQQEWQQVKAKYREFEAEMEERLAALSEDSKQKYNNLKARFKEWQAEVESELEDNQTISDKQVHKEWQNRLLGEFADTASITSDNVQAAYLVLMENVREQHENWTEAEWEHAENVYELLNQRKGKVEENIPVADEVKIKALQAEFKSLQAGDEVQDVVN